MTTTIGTVTLDHDMVWSDEYKYNPTLASLTPTIAGGFVLQEIARPSEKGRPITLESLGNQGYQKKSTVNALAALAASPNSTYTLTISHNSLSLTRTIRFVNEQQGGAVQFEPFTPLDGLQTAATWYKGTIYLMVW